MKNRMGLLGAGLIICTALGATLPAATASDHLDSPTLIADPAADIGDLYAWMSPDGKRLNLVMDIVGKQFSDQIAYVFHIDSGRRFGKTRATTTIDCRFDGAGRVSCEAAGDRAAGVADRPEGIESSGRVFRVFAGLRDDPFANNVRGTRQAYEVALLARMVQDHPVDGWAVLNGGSAPENIVDKIRDMNASRVLIVDAADMDLPPGSIRRIQADRLADPFLITTHTLPLSFLIEALQEYIPQVDLVGIQPGIVAFGFPMSAEVRSAVGQLYLDWQRTGQIGVSVMKAQCHSEEAWH